MLCFLSKMESTSTRRQYEVMCCVINKHFAWRLTLLCSYYSFFLLLRHTFFLLYSIHDSRFFVLSYHYDGCFSQPEHVLIRKNLNPFNFLWLQNMLWHTDPILSFAQSKKLLLYSTTKPMFSAFYSIIRKWCILTWADSNLLWRFLCWHWYGFI